jgi:hypothetical protein
VILQIRYPVYKIQVKIKIRWVHMPAYPKVPAPATVLRVAPGVSCVSVVSGAASRHVSPELQYPPSDLGQLWSCHVFRGSDLCLLERRAPVLPHISRPQGAGDNRNKEMLSCPRHVASLACFQSMFV